ncbi:MAG: 16S rRNA (uracil(1498)-N(3))-methyltransferase [Clostridia bacterium]|nr:16S rRNA (uracil(1498)-N(3))-methyltransferase [Clostridia bacterium]
MSRFFVPEQNIDDAAGTVTVTGTDVNHLKNVLRAARGTKIELVNTAGYVFGCTVETVGKDKIVCRIDSKEKCPAEPVVPLVLIQGVPKGEKADFLVQKCVELGVTGIIPAVTERTVVKFSGDADREKKRERWQRIATEAAKQSGRGAVPEITKPADFRDLMGALEPDWLKIIPYENEEERTLKQVLREYFPDMNKSTGDREKPKGIYVFIGPEGGFSAQEVEICRSNGFIPVTLGKRILRTETAGLAVVACVRYETGD